MRKIVAAIFAVIMCITCFSGCQSNISDAEKIDGNGVRIYVSLSVADTFRNTLVDTAKQTAEECGAEIVVYEAENSIENQVKHIKQAVSEDYDVIMCAPVDADTAKELEALAGDIPIIFYNSCPDESALEKDRYIYVGSDEKVAGQYQAEYILEHFSNQNEINVVIFKGAKNHSATNGRLEGLKNTLAASGKKINYVFEDYADWSQELTAGYFDIFLRTGQKADVIACQNDAMALGVIDICKKKGITDIPVLGIDATIDGCAAIESGDMEFTVYQSARGQGEMAVKAAIILGQGGRVQQLESATDDGCYIWVPFERVDSLNVSNYK